MKLNKQGIAALILALTIGCSSGKYETVNSYNVLRDPSAHAGKKIEGTIIDPENGFLYIGSPKVSYHINTDCGRSARKGNTKKAEKLSDKLAEINFDYTRDKFIAKGKYTKNEILEVKEIIIEHNGKISKLKL